MAVGTATPVEVLKFEPHSTCWKSVMPASVEAYQKKNIIIAPAWRVGFSNVAGFFTSSIFHISHRINIPDHRTMDFKQKSITILETELC